ncbi:MAG TPA: DUF4112 domain-containing protein [Pyrinomonadaceae bacterium]|jgi:hypothetical protein|nr:DUF4112 domain-containing protein [Pyrinomonadaceae bacterium]
MAIRAREVELERSARSTEAVKIEQSLDQLSRWMDGLFRIPGVGWRFGLDAIVGLVPGVGDLATTLVSFYILTSAVRYRVPKITLLRMGLNLGIDYVVGSVPVVGDLFDAWWKSNQMNVELLKRRATVSAEEARRGRLSDWLFLILIMLVLIALLLGSLALAFFILRFVARNLQSPF